jgi:hypothetical protein
LHNYASRNYKNTNIDFDHEFAASIILPLIRFNLIYRQCQ